ncbi:hypothetical protein B0A65_16985 [Flavobacterium frigidimaris]|uniref:Uncharacterized protein n=1 Tax=Flavobacterium frigidimaris TaxID=262320 RepID=A0ABX4BNC3_FLAFR|nr:hypothetical protein B0A65_16985 [Flavobacterium frigidimaris]
MILIKLKPLTKKIWNLEFENWNLGFKNWILFPSGVPGEISKFEEKKICNPSLRNRRSKSASKKSTKQ